MNPGSKRTDFDPLESQPGVARKVNQFSEEELLLTGQPKRNNLEISEQFADDADQFQNVTDLDMCSIRSGPDAGGFPASPATLDPFSQPQSLAQWPPGMSHSGSLAGQQKDYSLGFHRDPTQISGRLKCEDSEWRSDADIPHRKQMLQRLFERVQNSNSSPLEKSKLHLKAIEIEARLYYKAPSLRDYLFLWKCREIKEEAARIVNLENILREKKRALQAALNELPADKRTRLVRDVGVVSSAVKSSDGKASCAICQDSPADGAMIPCGHQCLCFGCSQQLMALSSDCPVCQQPAQGILQVKTQVANLE